jgi:hypothetical protein
LDVNAEEVLECSHVFDSELGLKLGDDLLEKARLVEDAERIMSSTYRRRYAMPMPVRSTNNDESDRVCVNPMDVTNSTKRVNQARGACRRP